MSVYYVGSMTYDSDYLAHHGIKGQKWGIRRYQNPDGSLTNAGKERYLKAYEEATNAHHDKWDSGDPKIPKGDPKSEIKKRIDKTVEKNLNDTEYREKKQKTDKALKDRNKRIFPSKKLDSIYKSALKSSSEAYDKVIKNALLETYDYAQKLPKKERAAAMAYIYEALGLDW